MTHCQSFVLLASARQKSFVTFRIVEFRKRSSMRNSSRESPWNSYDVAFKLRMLTWGVIKDSALLNVLVSVSTLK